MSSTGAGWTHFVCAARRRGVVVLAALLLGALCGLAVVHFSPASYASSALLVVPSGARSAGPGAASDAQTLAATYAAEIPQDAAVHGAIAATTGIPATQVASRLTITVESGSALLDLRFTAPSAAKAVAGTGAPRGSARSPALPSAASRPVRAGRSSALGGGVTPPPVTASHRS